jgi:alpha-L-fucosidase
MHNSDSLSWFREARFGMFIHWGLYSLLGRGEWALHNEGIPIDDYARLSTRWQPRPGCAREWAALAREAGMGYMVLTTKHHDGFCLFDTRTTDFSAVRAVPAGRDWVADYVEACRAEGLRVGLYYSIGDWSSAVHRAVLAGDASQVDALRSFIHTQVEELLTHYGTIDLLWYDGAFYDGQLFTAESIGAAELNARARELQPGILINPRAGVPGDFDTPEGAFPHAVPAGDWELCACINDMWGYTRHDHQYKSRNQLLFLLANCACQGGNLLLNIGPKPDGGIPARQRQRLQELGDWLAVNGEAVRGTERLPRPMSASGRVARKGRALYYHIFYWPGRELAIADLDDATLGGPVGAAPVRARLLAGGGALTTRWEGRRLIVTGLPSTPPDPADTVLVLEVE